MSFRSVHHILGSLEKQDSWLARQQLQRLLAVWAEVVGSAVAAQTRPLFIQRQVLQVATSNSAWAQNLAFERRRILEKLNGWLPLDLTDIRFSTAQWRSSGNLLIDASASLWQQHPSRVQPVSTDRSPLVAQAPTPEGAFRGWSADIKQRSQHLPLCPACHCPTPAGELERWAVCALCIVKRW